MYLLECFFPSFSPIFILKDLAEAAANPGDIQEGHVYLIGVLADAPADMTSLHSQQLCKSSQQTHTCFNGHPFSFESAQPIAWSDVGTQLPR